MADKTDEKPTEAEEKEAAGAGHSERRKWLDALIRRFDDGEEPRPEEHAAPMEAKPIPNPVTTSTLDDSAEGGETIDLSESPDLVEMIEPESTDGPTTTWAKGSDDHEVMTPPRPPALPLIARTTIHEPSLDDKPFLKSPALSDEEETALKTAPGTGDPLYPRAPGAERPISAGLTAGLGAHEDGARREELLAALEAKLGAPAVPPGSPDRGSTDEDGPTNILHYEEQVPTMVLGAEETQRLAEPTRKVGQARSPEDGTPTPPSESVAVEGPPERSARSETREVVVVPPPEALLPPHEGPDRPGPALEGPPDASATVAAAGEREGIEPGQAEVRVEEVKAEEIKAEEVRVEEVQAEEVRVEEVKAEEVKAEEIKAEEARGEPAAAEATTAPTGPEDERKLDGATAEAEKVEEEPEIESVEPVEIEEPEAPRKPHAPPPTPFMPEAVPASASPPPAPTAPELAPLEGFPDLVDEDPETADELQPPLDLALKEASATDLKPLIVALSAEMEAEEDKGRKALLQHEIGHILQYKLQTEADSVKSYAKALNLDPHLRPNAWAIRRIFVSHKLWPNLLKLLEAQVRFEEDPRRKAEVLLEIGWLHEDRLSDTEQATRNYLAAHEANPDWIAPLLALEGLAVLQRDLRSQALVYRKMATVSKDPARKVMALLNLAAIEEELGGGSPQTALDILREALAVGPYRSLVLLQMRRVASSANLASASIEVLRQQAAGLFDGDEARKRHGAAFLRQAALVARDQLVDSELASRILEEALGHAPDDPLLQRELLSLSELRSDWTKVEQILASQLESAATDTERAELNYRIGIARLQSGSGDPQEALDRALATLPGYLPAFVEKERHLLSTSAFEGLVELYLAEAAAIETRSAGLPKIEAAPEWIASALFRAASILGRRLGQPERAIELCRRGLATCPGHRPSLDLLEDLLARSGRHAEHAKLLEDRLASADPALSVLILESLCAITEGPLDDAEGLLRSLERLVELRPDDASAQRRMVPVLERLKRYEKLETLLLSLEKTEENEPLLLSWKLQRARLYEGPLRRLDAAIEVYREVLARSPGEPYAFIALDLLYRREKRFEDLAQLLRQAADESSDEEKRTELLRELGILCTRDLEKPQRAVAVYSELCALRPDDRAALRDLCRAAEAAGDTPKIAEALEAEVEHAVSPEAKAVALLRLAEFFEDRLSDPERAEEMRAKAVALSCDRSLVLDAVEALAWRQISRGDHAEAVDHLRTAASVAPEGVGRLLLEECAWITSGPLQKTEEGAELWTRLLKEEPGSLEALLALTKLAAQKRDPAGLAEHLSRLAATLEDPEAAAVLNLRAAILYDASASTTSGTAAEHYRKALQGAPSTVEALLGLLAQDDVHPVERCEILKRLADLAPEKLREEMRISLAIVYERAGRIADALDEIRPLLEKDPDDLTSLTLLHRIAQASGSREQEASVWVRIARLVSSRTAKAEAYSRAGEILLALGRLDQATILFRHVLANRPEEKHAFDRLHKLYSDAGDSRGLDELLGHRIQHAESHEILISLHFERARLRLESRGDVLGAARDLLQILKLDSKHLEALRQLAKLYDDDENAAMALELYGRYVETCDSVALKRPAVLRMADLLREKLGKAGEAVEVCRRFLELSSEDDTVLEKLAEIYIFLKDFPHAIETLEQLGTLRSDRAWKAQNLRRIGNLYRVNMKDTHEAQAMFQKARDLDPTNIQVIGDLRSLYKDLVLKEEAKDLLDRAKYDLRDAMAGRPHDVELYRKLMQIAEWDEDQYTLLAALGGLCFLNAATEEDQDLYRRRIAITSFEPKRHLGIQAWRETLTEGGAKSAYGEIWAVIAETVPKLFEGRVPGDPAAFGVGKSERMDRRAGGPVSNTIDRIANAFGLGEFEIYLASSQPDVVAGVAGEKLAIIVGHHLVTAMDSSKRFRIGRTLSLLRDRAFALEILDRAELELLFSAAIFTVEPTANFQLPLAQVEAESRRLQRVLPRKAKKSLLLAVARFMQEGGDLDQWIPGILATANRAGLLVSGDVIASMEHLCGDGRDRRRLKTAQIVETVDKNKQAARLLAYSVSAEYLKLRRELQV
jgi:tetratricopeptide (TPR) repeat protein